MTVLLNEEQVADLFLDHDKIHLDAAYEKLAARADQLDKNQLRDPMNLLNAALREDAKNFSRITGVDPDWLVETYIERS